MKVCVTAQGVTLESNMDSRFGRCAYFLIVDTDTMEFEVIDNNQVQATGGAGVKSGQLIAEKEVKAVLTGNVGPNAWRILQSAGIEIITGVTGPIRNAVEHYKKGLLAATDSPTVEPHFGLGGNDS